MPTGNEYVNLALKRFLSQNRMSENFLTYLQEQHFDGLSRIFPVSGLFTYPVTITPAAGSFDLSPDPIEGTDGDGHVIIVTGNPRLNGVPFENTPGDTYWIGLHYIVIPSGVYLNPRTGVPEFDKYMEEVGEIDDPSSVTNLVGTLRINCNSIFEASIDHSGREVLVGLKNPMSGDAAVAFEVCTVAYDAGSGENRITTTGVFGQATVSTSVADYFIACLGCTVRKSVLNPFTDDYIIIGNIIGAIINPTEDTGAQVDLSGGGGHTLQRAYDGLAGSGSGRIINADDQAVEIIQENDAPIEHDVFNSKLRIVGDTDKALPTVPIGAADYEVGVDVKSRFSSLGSYINRTNVADSSGNGYLNNTETITVPIAGDQISFTRVGVDLTLPALNFSLHPGEDLEVVEISGSTAGNDGVYLINIVSNTALDLYNLDGSIASLSAEVATPGLTASIYRVTLKLGGLFTQNVILSSMDILNDLVGPSSNRALQVAVPNGSADTIKVLEVGRYTAAGSSVDTGVTAYANGDFHVDNDLIVSEDITVSNGDITVSLGGISTTVGDISAGDDLIAAGDITASAGNIIATLGNITATAGDVVAGDDVIANDDITATTGDITATAGDVVAGDDVKATNDFEYVSAKTVYMRYSPCDGISGYDTGVDEPYWNIPTVDDLDVMVSGITAGDNHGRLIVPLHLPDGCTIETVDAIVISPDGVGLEMELFMAECTYAPADYDSTRTQLGGSATTTITTLQTITINAGSHKVVNASERYYIIFRAKNNSTDRIYEIQVTCSVTEFRPTLA